MLLCRVEITGNNKNEAVLIGMLAPASRPGSGGRRPIFDTLKLELWENTSFYQV
jgi:hypothetical protein